MKVRKVIGIILLILGIAALGFGGFFYGKEYLATRNIQQLNTDKSYDNQLVAINGNLVSEETAYDEELLTGCNSAILLRDVKMIQWVSDDKGVRLAFANYPIDSFTKDNVTYTNPEFSKDLPRKVNYGVLKAGNVVLDESVLDLIANTRFVEKTPVVDINKNAGFNYKLTPYNSSYVTASDDWSIGEIKVDLYEVSDSALDRVTIVGEVNDNVMTNAKILNGSKLTTNEIQSKLLENFMFYLLIGVAGIVVIIIAIILLAIKTGDETKKKKKKKN